MSIRITFIYGNLQKNKCVLFNNLIFNFLNCFSGDTYFRSKVSPFANCFATVNSLPFYDMCLDMGSNSITNFTHNDHPAQKGACAVAMAYMESCLDEKLPQRVPEICLQ